MRRVSGWAAFNVRAKLKWMVATGAIIATAVAAACSDQPPNLGAGGSNPLPTSGTCASPAEGCACDSAGATAACGQVISRQGDYVTCSEGTITCDGTKWGACKGDHTLFRSAGPLGDLRPLGLGSQGACTDNPCDPNCQVITDNGAGLDAGPGFQPVGDGGLTLVPESGTLCVGLQCQIASCNGNVTTNLTGTVLDPAGLNPIYNAYVYIPATLPLPAIPQGAQADPCGGGGNLPPSVTYALTGPDGKFTLTNAPAGSNIPVVVQAGKWRRMVQITVPSCQTTAMNPGDTRLPRNQNEGNLPHLAITANGCDPMECLIKRIGVDTSEFRDPGAGGKVDYYLGDGAPLSNGTNPNPKQLLSSVNTLKQYDLVMLPCDCGNEYGGDNTWWHAAWNVGQAEHNNLVSYANVGGRIFASHYGREWIEGAHLDGGYTEPFPGVANWAQDGAIQNQPGSQLGNVNQSFQRGVDFSTWLGIVGASPSPGTITINPTRYDAYSVTSLSQLWVQYSQGIKGPADFTFNTPLNQPINQQYGRVMFTDMHLAIAGGGGWTFPNECTSSALTSQEKAAEFLLMDLGACLQPLPPPVPPSFTSSTFVRTFTASCPVGKFVQWRTFYWEDITPGDSNIVFSAQTGDTTLTLLPSVPLATVSGAPNYTWVGAAVDVALKNANQVSHAILQVSMQMNPTSNKYQAPTLLGWQQTFDCVDSL